MHAKHPSSRVLGPDRRRPAVGHHGAAVEAGDGLAAPGVARLHPLRASRRHLADCPRAQGACRVPPSRAGERRAGLRRVRGAAKPRHRAHQRDPRGPDHRRAAGADRDHRGGFAAQRGKAGGLGRVRRVAGRRKPGRRRQGRRRDFRRRCPGAGVTAALGRVHGGTDPTAARPRSGRRDGRAVPGRRPRRAAGRPGDRGPSRRHNQPWHAARHRRTRVLRHRAAVHAVRLWPDPGVRGGRGRLRQPGAAGWRHGGRRGVRQPRWLGSGRRRHGHPGRYRAEQPAPPAHPAGAAHPAGGAHPARPAHPAGPARPARPEADHLTPGR
jgi:hypothetical protein